MLSYAGQHKPWPDAQVRYAVGTDLTMQLYATSMLESLAFFDNEGCETVPEWHDRDFYLHALRLPEGGDRLQLSGNDVSTDAE